jgi:hypothetical protein
MRREWRVAEQKMKIGVESRKLKVEREERFFAALRMTGVLFGQDVVTEMADLKIGHYTGRVGFLVEGKTQRLRAFALRKAVRITEGRAGNGEIEERRVT